MSQPPVYFVDDEEVMRMVGEQALTLDNFDVTCFDRAEAVLEQLPENWPGVIVTDIKMPGTSGLELMQRVLNTDAQLPVILISGHADIATAIQAIRDGAYDFIEKPFGADQLRDVVRRATEVGQLVLDNRKLRLELAAQRAQSNLLGNSNVITQLNQTIEYVGQTDADVLIFGETGTGKEPVAQCLHQCSPRAHQHFVPINCGAMPETIFESEIFGHVRGAFTGADKTQIGKLEYAHRGTFFLDEIESMPMNLQIKMLRVLQERKLQRLGSNEEINLDLRVVAATKEDLRQASTDGHFREDLYYRLNVITLLIPPLRERKEDIPILFQHFFDLACERMNLGEQPMPLELLQQALDHDWPGNVRELKNHAERAAIRAGNPMNRAEAGAAQEAENEAAANQSLPQS